jgi:hypothetical protein
MITWNERENGTYYGDCLSKDVPSLPKTGQYAANGSGVYVIDTPDGTNATSKYYKFDAENKVWIPQ